MSLDQRLKQAEREFRAWPHGGSAERLHHLREQAAITRNEPTINDTLKAEKKALCPDGGTCHHSCEAGPCFRVKHCGPLSKVFPNDEWPIDIKTEHLRREGS